MAHDGPAENPSRLAQNPAQKAPTADLRPSGRPNALAATGPYAAAPSWTVQDPAATPSPETGPEVATGAGTLAVPPGLIDPPRDYGWKSGQDPAARAERQAETRAQAGTVDRNADPAAAAERDTETPTEGKASKPLHPWPVLLLALPAFVAVWSGWVGLGEMTGFGVVHPLPGIADGFTLNTAITLPIGVETYAAFALHVWLSGRAPARARKFAMISALSSLGLGAAGQVAFHLLEAAGVTVAPWWITTVVAILPVAVLGMGAALAHLIRAED
ncbi:ABC transporter permease [Kribbella sp. CA-247076]|uniref:ABC transporter permease n=1 Tax=Kribbella sp. CA-247076 TaxID=3239941 RepID=UPI003D8B21B3